MEARSGATMTDRQCGVPEAELVGCEETVVRGGGHSDGSCLINKLRGLSNVE